MSFDGHVTRYSVMPIPPVEENTTWFHAGTVRVGVEYRLLDDAIAPASNPEFFEGTRVADRAREVVAAR